MRIALFVTCLGDTLYPETGKATVELLERLGHEVVFPAEQTCCGQMHANSGYRDEALGLVERFERIFDGYDVVVSPSASCVGHVREHAPSLAARVFELSELLVHRLGVEDVGGVFPHPGRYPPTPPSLRGTEGGAAPPRRPGNVRGPELVPLERAEECCGFGGTFAIKNADTSSAILADKCDAVVASGAGFCTAVDGSCLLQIGGGLARRAAGVRTLHLAEILAATEGA